MRTLRDPNRLEDVSDPAIRQLLALRFAQLGAEQPYDPDEIGHLWRADPGICADPQAMVAALAARPAGRTFTGWTAQIIQHEIDHCNGIII